MYCVVLIFFNLLSFGVGYETKTNCLIISNLCRHYMVINFECQKCGTLFDCDIGAVTFPEGFEADGPEVAPADG